jgi:rare lipoprotein A
MRLVLVTALLALGLSVGASLPAAASGSSDHVRQKDVRDRASSDDESRPARRRVARATTGDIDEDYEARPRQRYEASDDDRPRASPRRQARAVKRSKHRHATRRSGRRVAQHRSNRRTARAYNTERATRMVSRDYGGREINGIASYYWQDQRVATGARFNPEGMTAAHRTLPFGTRVRVTHMGNGRSVNVVINDRGPFIAGRIIDLARGAARVIGMTGQGLARVNVTVLGR